MDNFEHVSLYWKVLIAIFGSLFGLAIAISLQHIRILYIPKLILVISIVIQFILSLGVFLGVMLFFSSDLLPQIIPNDDYTALTIAYLAGSIPQIIVSTALIFLDKQIEKILKDKYGEDPRNKRYRTLSKMKQNGLTKELTKGGNE